MVRPPAFVVDAPNGVAYHRLRHDGTALVLSAEEEKDAGIAVLTGVEEAAALTTAALEVGAEASAEAAARTAAAAEAAGGSARRRAAAFANVAEAAAAQELAGYDNLVPSDGATSGDKCTK